MIFLIASTFGRRLQRVELLSLEPVSFAGRLRRAEPGFLLDWYLEFDGTVACARCLRPVPFRRTGPVSWVFAPAHARHLPVPDADGETELQATDLDVVFYDDFTVPFDLLIDEQVQLEIRCGPSAGRTAGGLSRGPRRRPDVSPCSCAPPETTAGPP